jgi:hypothetical protein
MTVKEVYDLSKSFDFSRYLQIVRLEKELSSLALSDEEKRSVNEFDSLKDLFQRKLPLLEQTVFDSEQALSKELSILQYRNDQCLFETSTGIFYKEILDSLVSSYLDNFSQFLTEAYQTIYQDELVTIKLVVEDVRNKRVIRIQLLRKDGENIFVEDISSQGGACAVVLGILVNIRVILLMNLPRVMFIDEQLSVLDSDKLNRFLDILNGFGEAQQFKFYIISHDIERFKGHIKSLYTVKDGVYLKVCNIDRFIEDIV